MKCSKAQRLISDHVDNLLETGQVRDLKSHIKDCPACRELFIDMGSIVKSAKELEPVLPSENLWPAVKRQVLKEIRKDKLPVKSLFRDFFIHSRGPVFALSTLMAVFILIPLIYYIFPRSGVMNNDPEIAALNHFRIAEQHYQSAIKSLDRAIETRSPELSPELDTVFKKNLEIIDDSIRICRAAVEQHPENPEANRLLLICYTKKIELLNEIKDIAVQTG